MTEKNTDYSAMGLRSAQVRRLAAIERRIQELVDAAPEISEAQRERLVVLLRGSAAA